MRNDIQSCHCDSLNVRISLNFREEMKITFDLGVAYPNMATVVRGHGHLRKNQWGIIALGGEGRFSKWLLHLPLP